MPEIELTYTGPDSSRVSDPNGNKYILMSDGETVSVYTEDGKRVGDVLPGGNSANFYDDIPPSPSAESPPDPFTPASITSFGNPTGAVVATPGIISQDEAAGYIASLGNLINANTAGTDTMGSLNTQINDLISGYSNPYETQLADFTKDYRNPYYDQLDGLLKGDTQYSWLTDAQNELINQAYSGRQAQFNALAIGDSPSAQSAIAAAGAGTLADFYSDYVNNLLVAASGYTTDQQTKASNLANLAGLDLSQYQTSLGGLQDLLNSSTAAYGTDLQTLLSMAGFGQPTVSTVGGTD